MALLSFLTGCTSDKSHKHGEPYFFKHGVTHQGHRPTDEITETEALALADDGYAYYIAYFSSDGDPIEILKVYQGSTNRYWKTSKTKD